MYLRIMMKNFSINMSKIKPLYYYVNTKIMKTMFKIEFIICLMLQIRQVKQDRGHIYTV